MEETTLQNHLSICQCQTTKNFPAILKFSLRVSVISGEIENILLDN